MSGDSAVDTPKNWHQIKVVYPDKSEVITNLSKDEREITLLTIKIKEERDSKIYLSEAVQKKKLLLAKQTEEYSRHVFKAEELVEAAKLLDIQSQGTIDKYEKIKEKLEGSQHSLKVVNKNLNQKANNRLKKIDILRRENDDLIFQLSQQTKVIQDQRLFLEAQLQKEDELEQKRQAERLQYADRIDNMLKKYQQEQTKLRIEALQDAIRDVENAGQTDKINNVRDFSEGMKKDHDTSIQNEAISQKSVTKCKIE